MNSDSSINVPDTPELFAACADSSEDSLPDSTLQMVILYGQLEHQLVIQAINQ